MNISQLRPLGDFAMRSGVKTVVYGPPGSGKTPISNTAPRPVILVSEPGVLSVRTSIIPAWGGTSPKLIDEFFDWFFGSNERRNFDTLIWDSVSYGAETYLQAEFAGTSKAGNAVHGEKAYGNMLKNVMRHLRRLFFAENCHTYLICQQGIGSNGNVYPGFPGRALEKEVPHLFDEILHLGLKNVPGYGLVPAFQTQSTFDILARDRSGKLAMFEPPDLAGLFAKAMS